MPVQRSAEERPLDPDRPADPRLARVRTALTLLLLAVLVYLAGGEKPWDGGIAERLREGKPLRGIDYARTFGWWTAAANAVVLAVLLATVRRWLGPRDVPAVASLARPRHRSLAFFLLVAGAVAMEAVLAWPRLFLSYWHDEMSTVAHFVHGSYVRERSGELVFDRVRWRDTLWAAPQPANHFGFSVVSRLSLEAWQLVTRPEHEISSEPATRLPSYLAGLGSLVAVALLLRRIGLPRAGACAAWILALHPWHIRYTSEARGYALVMLLIPVTWILLLDVLERGSWRRWLAFGLAHVLLVWTHSGTVYELAVMDLVALLALHLVHRGTPRWRDQLVRGSAAALVCVAVGAQLMLPNLVQLAVYMSRWTGRAGRMNFDDLTHTLSHVFAGVVWTTRDPASYVSLEGVRLAHPIAFHACVALTVLLIAVGTARLLAGGGIRALLAPILLVPGPLAFATAWSQELRYYPWYVVFALPGLAALVAVGLEPTLDRERATRTASGLAAACMVGYLALFAFVTQVPRQAIRSVAVMPLRDSVLLTRPTLDPRAPENARILTASFHYPAFYYDPATRNFREVRELQRLMRQADTSCMPLFVNYGRPKLSRRRYPEVVALLERDEDFERVALLHSLERGGDRFVYRYRGRRPGAPRCDER